MQITSITPQKHDAARCNIDLDGRFFCGMKLETVVLHRLKVGSVVTEEELSAMQLESEKSAALDKAFSFLSHSMKSEREVREHLKSKGFLSDVIDDAVEKLRGYGYLDDGAYARAYVEHGGKKKGKRLLAAELKQKGIDPALAEEALSSFKEEDPARAVLQKYLRGKPADEGTFRKAYAYLISKGFDYDAAREALRSLREGDEGDEA